MTSEALREAIAEIIRKENLAYMLVNTGDEKKQIRGIAAQQILTLLATSLPEKKTYKGVNESVQADTRGYNQALDEVLKLLGGGNE